MFAVTHTQIAQWRKKEEQLKKASIKCRKVGSGNKPAYYLAENVLKEWIVSLRNRELGVTPSIVKSELLSYAFSEQYPNAVQEFKESDAWFTKTTRTLPS